MRAVREPGGQEVTMPIRHPGGHISRWIMRLGLRDKGRQETDESYG